MKYQKPQLYSLDEWSKAQGACNPGSRGDGNCQNGNIPAQYGQCKSGNEADDRCQNGVVANYRCRTGGNL